MDLRLAKRKKCKAEVELESPLFPDRPPNYEPLSEKTEPEVDFSGFDIPPHLSTALLSYFPKATGKDSLVLDLGCGDTVHRGVCEHAGYEYVGLDYENPRAPIQGDAQSLPFRDNSFEFILSMNVLEHIRFPFLMMREAYRVLKPRGTFVGSVAFLEPFHHDSYYHHTHLGTLNSLRYGGFAIEHIAPSDEWSALVAISDMVLFPKMPKYLTKFVVLPLQALHKLWWQGASWLNHRANAQERKANEQKRILITTGAFDFVATKEVADQKPRKRVVE